MTNKDIYDLVNFIIRKDTKGNPNNLVNFSRLLQQANSNHFRDEYNIYQVNQNVNDSMSPFEVIQSVYSLTNTTTTITLPTNYAHFIGMYWVDSDSYTRPFDLVTDSGWDMRNNSTISVPTNTYPICKLVSDKIYVKPSLNYVVYEDWFLPSKDELIAMHTNLHAEGVGSFTNNNYWSSSEVSSTNATNIRFSTGTSYSAGKNNLLYVRAARVFTQDPQIYSLRDTGPAGGLIFYINGTTTYEAAPSDQSVGYVWSNVDDTAIGTTGTAIGDGVQNTADVIAQAGHSSSSAKVCDDLQIVIGASSNINVLTLVLWYIKKPITPIYDYYIDINGNYVYLEEGATHVWTTGEIDSTGTIRTTGQPNWSSLTVELEWKYQDKLKIASRILQAMGLNTKEADVFKYAQQLKNEQ